MTDSEKLDDIQKKVKRLEIAHIIQVSILLLGFIGIVSMADVVNKIKSHLSR